MKRLVLRLVLGSSLPLGGCGGDEDAKVKECFDEALTEERVRGLLVATFSGDQDAATQELTAPLMKCAMGGLTPPEK